MTIFDGRQDMTLVRTRAPHALIILVAAIAALMCWAADARAQGAAPAPCTGMIFTDPEGDEDAGPDAVNPFSLADMPSPLNRRGQDPYLDITGAFFNYADAGGKKVLTANIKLRDLVPTVPAESYEGAVQYIADFDAIGAVEWVRAVYDGSAWAFDYGLLEEEDRPPTPTATTGRVFTGPGGVVQIDFPVVPEIAGGLVIEGIQAITGMWAPSADGRTSLWFYSDIAPDDDEGTYTVEDCPASASQTPQNDTPTKPGPSPSAPPPASSNPPAAGGQQQPGPTHVNRTTLPFTTGKSLGSARKAAKKRRLVFKARASATITKLVVQLRKGRKVVGTAKAATFSGTRKLKLKLKSRKLKKGAYKLVATGTVDGRPLGYSRKVTLKK